MHIEINVIIIWILKIYIYFATITCLLGIFKDRDFDIEPLLGFPWLNDYFVYPGAVVGLIMFFVYGFDGVFSFIPENFGYDFEGEFFSYRGKISFSCSVITVFLTYKIISKYKTMKTLLQKNENQNNKNDNENT
jgi:hypothetical protein